MTTKRIKELEEQIRELMGCIEELETDLAEAESRYNMPTYERTIGEWLRLWYQQDAEFEFPLANGKKVDIVVNGNTLIEIKRLDSWQKAVGQLQCYKYHYCEMYDIPFNEVKTELVIFAESFSSKQREEINNICKMSNIDSVRFFCNPGLLLDRR